MEQVQDVVEQVTEQVQDAVDPVQDTEQPAEQVHEMGQQPEQPAEQEQDPGNVMYPPPAQPNTLTVEDVKLLIELCGGVGRVKSIRIGNLALEMYEAAKS